MSRVTDWQCDLCGKKDFVEDRDSMPSGWNVITVRWSLCTRTGHACSTCTNGWKVPEFGMIKYWQNVIKFLGAK